MVNAIVDGMRKELPDSARVKVIATGGQSRIIAPLTDRFAGIDPWLTLDGIRLIVERNA
jgi:type III pantothenate kinase